MFRTAKVIATLANVGWNLFSLVRGSLLLLGLISGARVKTYFFIDFKKVTGLVHRHSTPSGKTPSIYLRPAGGCGSDNCTKQRWKFQRYKYGQTPNIADCGFHPLFSLPPGIAQPQVPHLRPPQWNEIKYQDTHLLFEHNYSTVRPQGYCQKNNNKQQHILMTKGLNLFERGLGFLLDKTPIFRGRVFLLHEKFLANSIGLNYCIVILFFPPPPPLFCVFIIIFF